MPLRFALYYGQQILYYGNTCAELDASEKRSTVHQYILQYIITVPCTSLLTLQIADRKSRRLAMTDVSDARKRYQQYCIEPQNRHELGLLAWEGSLRHC